MKLAYSSTQTARFSKKSTSSSKSSMSPMVSLSTIKKEPGKNDKEIYCVIVNYVSFKKAPQKIWHKPQVKSYSHCFP
jgi:hypothetical protein